MKTAVLYYTLSGSTRRYARAEADARQADLFEITPAKKYGTFSAYLRGCPAALRQQAVPLSGNVPNLAPYERIVLMAPVWAGFPAPVFNSMIKLLPSGREVEVILTSASGHSDKSTAKVRALIEGAGGIVVAQRDIRVHQS